MALVQVVLTKVPKSNPIEVVVDLDSKKVTSFKKVSTSGADCGRSVQAASDMCISLHLVRTVFFQCFMLTTSPLSAAAEVMCQHAET